MRASTIERAADAIKIGYSPVARYLLKRLFVSAKGAAEDRTMNEEQIRQFLDRYGRALSAGDLAEIADCWAVPALVLADDGALSVSTSSQVEQCLNKRSASITHRAP